MYPKRNLSISIVAKSLPRNAVVYKNMVAKSCATLLWSSLISKENNLFIFCIDITNKVF